MIRLLYGSFSIISIIFMNSVFITSGKCLKKNWYWILKYQDHFYKKFLITFHWSETVKFAYTNHDKTFFLFCTIY